MNLILFEQAELDRPLAKTDVRAVHLVKVLHKKAGDEFDAGVFDGKRGKGCITCIENGAVFCSFNLNQTVPPRLPLELAIGFPRPIQLKRILRELSSMGVGAISLFGTELGEKSYRDTTLLSGGGARAALVEGAAQGRDTSLPSLRVFPSIKQWLCADIRAEKTLVIADNLPPADNFAALTAGRQGIVIAIGSERGWTNDERALFEAAGFRRLSFGERALRTETAAVADAAVAITKLSAFC